MVILCYRVFSPFMSIMLWSVILAITLYPLQQKLARRLAGRQGLASVLLVLLAIVVLLLPAVLLGSSMVASVHGVMGHLRAGELAVPAANAAVRQWPLIGEPVYQFWHSAHADLLAVFTPILPQVKEYALRGFGQLAGAGIAFLVFVAALMIAGLIMAQGERGARSAERILMRMVGERGPDLATLSVATIRAVALGVVGIAFVQMVLVGAGFVLKGIPGAELLALGILILGIMQLPATLIILPVLVYVFATDGVTLSSVAFTVYIVLAGLSDNVLKPLLLGRGVAVPMPVVLLGALGGMVSGGIIGLFIGPVLLGLGYQLFWHWVDREVPPLLPAGEAESEVSKASAES
ncbi:AI-2E family transporter [Pseudomonas sp. A3.4]|nr:AI-2E family transporter [Atopomonas sediminilitoris]